MTLRTSILGRGMIAALAAVIASGVVRGDQKPAVPPVDGETRFNNGLEHLRAGRLDMALEEFKAAVKLDPKNPYFFKGLGVAHSQVADRCPPKDQACRQRNLEAAVVAARTAIELNPYYADARNDLGTFLVRSGKREEGKKEFMTAFNDPTNPSPEFSASNMGQSFLEEKNYPQAVSWFQTSVGKNKTHSVGVSRARRRPRGHGEARRGHRPARGRGQGPPGGLGHRPRSRRRVLPGGSLR